MVAQRFFDSHSLVPVEDAAGSQTRTWRICSQKVNVRSEPLHEANRIRYAEAGEEFEATGPFRIQQDSMKKPSKTEWLCLANGGGYVCTTSSKDPGKLVATLKRKRNSTHIKEPDVALLIKPEWCDQIFDHGKVWEIRGEHTNKRGRFAIAASGTGRLLGEATLVDSLPVGKYDRERNVLEPYRNKKKYRRLFLARESNMSKHRIKDMGIVTYPKVFAWVLDDAVRYKTPVPYTHPQGAIKWVKLTDTGNTEIELMEEQEGGKSDASSASSSGSKSSDEGNEAAQRGGGGAQQDKKQEDCRSHEATPEAKPPVLPEAESPEPKVAALETQSPEAKAPAPSEATAQEAESPEPKVVAPETQSPEARSPAPSEATAREVESPEPKVAAKEIQSPEAKSAAPSEALQIPTAGTALMQRLQWATSMLNSGLTENDVVALLRCLLEATGDLGPEPAKAAEALKESNAGKAMFMLEKSASAAPRVTTLAKQVRQRWWAQAKPQRR